MSLFLTKRPMLEKTAQKLLGDAVEQWPNELLAELYREHSYLGSHQVDLQIQNQDEERGYAFGYFLISANRNPQGPSIAGGDVQNPSTAQVEMQGQQEGQPPALRIPVIVEAKMLKALDVFLTPDGKFHPLSEQRVAETMSFPETFEAIKPDGGPGSDAMNSFGVPERSGGMGGQGVGQVVKTSSIMQSIIGTVTPEQRDAFLEKLAEPELRYALRNNPAFRKVAGIVYKAKTAVDIDEQVRDWTQADVIHFSKTAGGYLMKSASAGAYHPDSLFIPRECADLLPEEVLEPLRKEGQALLSRVYENVPTIDGWEKIKEAGAYEVLSLEGSPMAGAFVSHAVGIDGKIYDDTVSGVVATDEGLRSVHQDAVKTAGRRLPPADLTRFVSEPKGQGVFVKLAAGRLVECTGPIEIETVVERGNGPEWVSDQGLITKVAGLRRPTRLRQDVYAIPGDWEFLPVVGSQHLTGDAGIVKTAMKKTSSVRVYGQGERYTFSGRAVDDLDGIAKNFVKEAEASLLMGCLGVDPTEIKEKLAEAAREGHVDIEAVRDVISFATCRDLAKTASRKLAAHANIKPIDLIKEAAELTSEMSVDAVLALGFLSPDNVQAFAQQADSLEQVTSTLAEMLVSARLGLKEIPEQAAERALQGIDAVVQGLKQLRARQQEAPPEVA